MPPHIGYAPMGDVVSLAVACGVRGAIKGRKRAPIAFVQRFGSALLRAAARFVARATERGGGALPHCGRCAGRTQDQYAAKWRRTEGDWRKD